MPYVIRHDMHGVVLYACGPDLFTTEPELATQYTDAAVERLLEKVPDAFYTAEYGCGLVKVSEGVPSEGVGVDL